MPRGPAPPVARRADPASAPGGRVGLGLGPAWRLPRSWPRCGLLVGRLLERRRWRWLAGMGPRGPALRPRSARGRPARPRARSARSEPSTRRTWSGRVQPGRAWPGLVCPGQPYPRPRELGAGQGMVRSWGGRGVIRLGAGKGGCWGRRHTLNQQPGGRTPGGEARSGSLRSAGPGAPQLQPRHDATDAGLTAGGAQALAGRPSFCWLRIRPLAGCGAGLWLLATHALAAGYPGFGWLRSKLFAGGGTGFGLRTTADLGMSPPFGIGDGWGLARSSTNRAHRRTAPALGDLKQPQPGTWSDWGARRLARGNGQTGGYSEVPSISALAVVQTLSKNPCSIQPWLGALR
jgi:hypothetical protein